VTLVRLGRRPYREVLALQRSAHAALVAGDGPEMLLVCEHEPTITLGRAAKPEHVLASPERLAARGIDVVRIERGGDTTYHGPGQLVAYPILRLRTFRDVVPLVGALERAAIATCATFGVGAVTRPEHRGAYVGNDAIAAVGLAVRGLATLHGIALDVAVPRETEATIVPCGMPAFGTISLARASGRPLAVADVELIFTRELLAALGREAAPTMPSAACSASIGDSAIASAA